LPAVRVFIDFLAERLPGLIEASRLDCQNCEHKTADRVQASAGKRGAKTGAAAPSHATIR